MADRKNTRQEAQTLERVMPTGGQVEPSAQLKAASLARNPFTVRPLPSQDHGGWKNGGSAG